MKSQALVLALLCLMAPAALGSRGLQQLVDPSVIPSYQGPKLTYVNAADPGAVQIGGQAQAPTVAPLAQPPSVPPPPPSPTAVPTPPAPAPTTVPTPPAPAPAVPPTPPAPAPTVPPTPPAPAPTMPPAPAPTVPTSPPAPAPRSAPVPAPTVTPTPPPSAPAPVPVPAPQPPPPPPQCGVKPQCRLFVEDMLCCGNSGAISSQQSVVYQLQCTHAVNYGPQCARIAGPANVSAFSQFQPAGWGASHTVQVNFLQEFVGTATIDIEGPRTDAKLSADCGLYITPCLLDGQLVTKVTPVQGMSFTALDPADFLDVSENLNNDLSNLNTLVYPSLAAPSSCQQQAVSALNATFYAGGWANYTGGFQNSCNATALQQALPPVSAPVLTAAG